MRCWRRLVARVFRGSDRGNNRSLVRWFAGGAGIAQTGGSRGRAVLAPRCGAFTSCVSLSDRHRRAVLARLWLSHASVRVNPGFLTAFSAVDCPIVVPADLRFDACVACSRIKAERR
ncbi:hypothetical protein JOE09_004337 [Pantoea coffeiphila]|nr:hypothetical protein [Pantoea coffeiphila]